MTQVAANPKVVVSQRCINAACRSSHAVDKVLTACPECGELLDVVYDWPVEGGADGRAGAGPFPDGWRHFEQPLTLACYSGVWKFHDLLPFAPLEQLVSVGKLPANEVIAAPPPLWQGADAAAVASVNYEGLALLEESWKWSGAPPLTVLGRDVPIPVVARVPDPSQVGSDRLVNALAWNRRSSRPAVLVDFGTAITLDIVSRHGEYCGAD